MESHLELSDNAFTKQFADCILDPKLFNHEAHIRLAWIHINEVGIEAAIKIIQKQIKKYVADLGAQDKYNSTLTVAAIQTVYHFMLKSNPSTFNKFRENHPRLFNNFEDLIEAHYSIDIFNSPKAKTEYLLPDLLPYDIKLSSM
ncbi:MAG: hypothetical protein AAGK97_12510 [Bacteroidota bacterium]